MTSWKLLLTSDNNVWRGVEAYADERIADLVAVCTAAESSETQIRQAQAGILELQRLKSLPQTLEAEKQIRQNAGGRKEY